MEVSNSNALTELQRRKEIQAQIAALQVKLDRPSSSTSALAPGRATTHASSGDKSKVLVPCSPAKPKVGNAGAHFQGHAIAKPNFSVPSGSSGRPASPPTSTAPASVSRAAAEKVKADRAREMGLKSGRQRDERMALIENLELGPKDFSPPTDDPNFEALEPNSGIRLKSRDLSHDSLQSFLTGRYYLPPSLLYSIVRLPSGSNSSFGSRNKASPNYDIPVEGEWVTIGVLGEKSEIRVTKRTAATAGQGRGMGDDEDGEDRESGSDDDDADGAGDRNGSQDYVPRKHRGGKKYLTFKLFDLGGAARSRSATASISAASAPAGDAVLNLLLFESDVSSRLPEDESGDGVRIYRGGSGGAFEKLWKEREGTVVAILHPRVLKPLLSAGPHPASNILAITPDSVDNVVIIGRALDYGTCQAMRKDGKRCQSFCDKRVSDVCEYHLQLGVQQKRAGRAEFFRGTSGMSTSPIPYRRSPKFCNSGGFDAARKWGLLPHNGATPQRPMADAGTASQGHTYVLAGGHSAAVGERSVEGRFGRRKAEKEARARRKAEEEEWVKHLLGEDDGPSCSSGGRDVGQGKAAEAAEAARTTTGAKYLELARAAKRAKVTKGPSAPSSSSAGLLAKVKASPGEVVNDDVAVCGDQGPGRARTTERAPFSAEAIRLIGFDPLGGTTSGAGKALRERSSKRTLAAIAALSNGERLSSALGKKTSPTTGGSNRTGGSGDEEGGPSGSNGSGRAERVVSAGEDEDSDEELEIVR